MRRINDYIQVAQQEAEKLLIRKQKIKRCKFDTIATHGVYSVDEALRGNQGAMIEPIYMSSSQVYRDAAEMEAALSYQIPSWCYSRIGNPSIYYLENTLALLEGYGYSGDVSCCATSSGMAAIQSATDPFLTMNPKKSNQKINFVASCQVYGGTFQQFSVRKMIERGIECRWVIDPTDLSEWESKIDENTRFLYGEAPSNPNQTFFDISQVVHLAHAYEIPLIFDNTIATPALLRPICHGVDVVIQSVTKTLTSSGFCIGGAVIARKNLVSKFGSDELKKDFAYYLKLLPNRDLGQNLSPMNAILSLNDIRTLRSKVDLFSRNAEQVARYLVCHPRIEMVSYLGLPENPLHRLASKYLYLVDAEYDVQYGKPINRYGHLISFCVKGGARAARTMFDALWRICRATDLGRVKSVATIPAISTHLQQGEQGRSMANIPSNLIRLCVGGEHPDDIIEDIDRALAAIHSHSKKK